MGQSTSSCKLCPLESKTSGNQLLAFCEKCKQITVENNRLKEEDFQKVKSVEVNQSCYNCSIEAVYFASTCNVCITDVMNDTYDCTLCHETRQGPVNGYFCLECMKNIPEKKRDWYVKNNGTQHPDQRCFSCWTKTKVYRLPVCQECYDSEHLSEEDRENNL